MRIQTIGNFNSIDAFVDHKMKLLNDSDRSFRSVFEIMNTEPDNTICESSDGYRIHKTSYREFKLRTQKYAAALPSLFSDLEKNAWVGLYLQNSEAFLEFFWAILMAGYRPLLMNTRILQDQLEHLIDVYDVKKIISDGKTFTASTIIVDDISLEGVDALSEDQACWANEIALMSSGTSEHVKLCVYNGENIYYQICDSAHLIRECGQIKKHYNGELKLLTFLPFYHIFGLFAVMMWFGFFSRTFVFLKDYSGPTILNTVKRHKVTHIFAVPLLWNTIYDTAVHKIADRGEKTKAKFDKGMKIASTLSGMPSLHAAFVKKAFKEVREEIFGDSISFMISGGSVLKPEVLSFFNHIGYRLANGYGMSETGITSVELSDNLKALTSCGIGLPLHSVEYKLDGGELLIRSKTAACRVYEDNNIIPLDEDGFFHTHDMAEYKDDRWFVLGRRDDVIIGPDGENINPDILEQSLEIPSASAFTIVKASEGTTLVMSVKGIPGAEKLVQIEEEAKKAIEAIGASGVITQIFITNYALMDVNEFKINRRKIASRIADGSIQRIVSRSKEEISGELESKLAEMIGDLLHKEASEIHADDNLFFDLKMTSIDYFTFIMQIQEQFDVSLPEAGGGSLNTVRDIAGFIEEQLS